MAHTTRIIIPTDFSVHSLGAVVDIIDQHLSNRIEVVLVYGRYSSTSITELFASSKDDLLNELQSEDFIKACEVIRSRFGERIKELYSDIMTSTNRNYVRNFIKGMRADEVYIPEGYPMQFKGEHAFDTREHLKNTGSPKVIIAQYQEEGLVAKEERDAISSLFFRKRLHVTF